MSVDESISDALLDRIRKVQALTTSTTLGEAQAATAKLSELLFKYNLELADLTVKGETQESSYVNEVFTFDTKNKVDNWKKRLVFSAAGYNFCRAVYSRHDKSMSIVGQAHNVAFVEWLAKKLLDELPRLSELAWLYWQLEEIHVHEREVTIHGRTWKTDFYHGAASEIEARLKQQWDESRGESEGSRALVVTSTAKLNQAFHDFYPRVHDVNVNTGRMSGGWSKGRDAGRGVGLNRPVGGSNASGRKELGSG